MVVLSTDKEVKMVPEESRVALPPGKLVLFDDFGSRVRVQSGVVSSPNSNHGSPAG